MAPSRGHRIAIHEDRALFREAVLFTAGQTGLNATLIEKDYYCSVVLQYLYGQPDCPLIFRGGTCIGKVYADFYRLSEDLDFLISMPPEAGVSLRKKGMAPVREWVKKVSEEIGILTLPADINSPSGQAYFRSKAKRTTNLASINSKEVDNLPVLLPDDTATQAAILLGLKKGQQTAASIRKQAEGIRTSAWKDFIAAVFT